MRCGECKHLKDKRTRLDGYEIGHCEVQLRNRHASYPACGPMAEAKRLREDLAEYIAEQDALCARLANARHEAARLGYCAGHNDTVEGTYADPAEVAADICQEMDDDERMGEIS